jgi:hypothetical protein
LQSLYMFCVFQYIIVEIVNLFRNISEGISIEPKRDDRINQFPDFKDLPPQKWTGSVPIPDFITKISLTPPGNPSKIASSESPENIYLPGPFS